MDLLNKKYKAYTINNFTEIAQVKESLTKEQLNAIKVVGHVLPFKVNNYVIEELIDWDNIPSDPIFQLTFPQKDMLSSEHFEMMNYALSKGHSKNEINSISNKIRLNLEPNPAGQKDNIPTLNGQELKGIQHKYKETVLFFPSHGQTCHAYCTFCFRWPQFVGQYDLKFAMKEVDLLIQYLQQHTEVTDLLITGGDPMVMSAKKLKQYIEPLLSADIPNLQTIRIGTKSLSYWPYRFINDDDSKEILELFEKVTNKGIHLAFMAHLNHPNELNSKAVKVAIKKILNTGAVIRTQTPIMNHINNRVEDWINIWNKQVQLGCIPYYMFIARNTGAQDYFSVTLQDALSIFNKAYQKVSGVARTVRGPSMSANPGKVQILGINEINSQKVFNLKFIQGRNPEWIEKPFFAKYDPDAIWLTDLVPLDEDENFFFEEETELVESKII